MGVVRKAEIIAAEIPRMLEPAPQIGLVRHLAERGIILVHRYAAQEQVGFTVQHDLRAVPLDLAEPDPVRNAVFTESEFRIIEHGAVRAPELRPHGQRDPAPAVANRNRCLNRKTGNEQRCLARRRSEISTSAQTFENVPSGTR